MTKKEFNFIAKRMNAWIKRQLSYEKATNEYKAWIVAKKVFNKFIKGYIKQKLYNNMDWDFQFQVFHQEINALKPDRLNHAAATVLFHCWCDIKTYLPDDLERFKLYDASEYIHDIKKSQKKLLKLKQNLETLNTNKHKTYLNKYFEYRDIVGIISSFEEAEVLTTNGIEVFPLEWDWWFNIDNYLDLIVGWNKLEK